LGDIVVCDIGQPQCYKWFSSLCFTMFLCFSIHLWYCDWPMSPTTILPNAKAKIANYRQSWLLILSII